MWESECLHHVSSFFFNVFQCLSLCCFNDLTKPPKNTGAFLIRELARTAAKLQVAACAEDLVHQELGSNMPCLEMLPPWNKIHQLGRWYGIVTCQNSRKCVYRSRSLISRHSMNSTCGSNWSRFQKATDKTAGKMQSVLIVSLNFAAQMPCLSAYFSLPTQPLDGNSLQQKHRLISWVDWNHSCKTRPS